MAEIYEIPAKVERYLKRISSEYRRNGKTDLSDVLEGSKFQINENTAFDNWNGGMTGHDLVFMVPDELMGFIPLDGQQEIQRQLQEDLNKASSAVHDEFFNDIHFEYLEDQSAPNLRSLNTTIVENAADLEFWLPDTIRLFISHRDTRKEDAHKLANSLTSYGVSSFVAHDTIEPDEDWQKEIEKALQTMHVMLTFITDDFFESAWTNQEIGFALARGVPVISIKFEKSDPIGFIRNRQAITGSLDTMPENARKIFTTIEKRLEGSSVYRSSMLSRFVNVKSFSEAENAFEPISRMKNFSRKEIEWLIDAFNSNSQINGCWALTNHYRYFKFVKQHSDLDIELNSDKIDFVSVSQKKEMPF